MDPILPLLKRALPIVLAVSFLVSPIWAQDTLAPRSQVVDLDNECVLKPKTITSGDRTIVVWQRDYPDGGIYARQGTALDELGPTTRLIAQLQSVLLESSVIPLPGGFAVAWTVYAEGLRLQRFDLDLTPLGPPVQIATGHVEFDHDFDELGNFTLAFRQQGNANLEVRRFSPLGQQVDAVTVTLSPVGHSPRFSQGNGSFLVVWHVEAFTDTYAQAFSNSGVPLGPVMPLGAGEAEVAHSEDGYLVLRGSFTHLLGEDGVSLGDNVYLGVSANEPTLAASEDGYWAAWLSSSDGIVFGAQLDRDGRLVGVPTVLRSIPPGRPAMWPSLQTYADGFRLSWIEYSGTAIPAPICDYEPKGYVQDFGPSRGVVDVPVTTTFGLVITALLFAAAGLLVRRLN